MNDVSVEPYKTNVLVEPYGNYVTLELTRVESEFSFLSPFHIIDNPKERGT